jgi:hypothetical protein
MQLQSLAVVCEVFSEHLADAVSDLAIPLLAQLARCIGPCECQFSDSASKRQAHRIVCLMPGSIVGVLAIEELRDEWAPVRTNQIVNVHIHWEDGTESHASAKQSENFIAMGVSAMRADR